MINIDDFLKEMKIAEISSGTIGAYRSCLSKFYEFLQDDELTKEKVIEFKDHLVDLGYK